MVRYAPLPSSEHSCNPWFLRRTAAGAPASVVCTSDANEVPPAFVRTRHRRGGITWSFFIHQTRKIDVHILRENH